MAEYSETQANKGDRFQSLVRVEFDGTLLGESDEKQGNPMQDFIDYKFTCIFRCPNDAQALSDIAKKPIVLTVIEVLAEEKNDEPRQVPLGQAVVDLLPLLQGQCSFPSTISVNPVPNPRAESAYTGLKLPTLDVSVSVLDPILSEADLSASNLLKVTLETAYSVPDSWMLPSGPAPTTFTYTAALEIPLTADQDQVLVFPEGQLKAGGQREEKERQKKRPHRDTLVPENHFLPGVFFKPEEIDQEDGELTALEDRAFRDEAETTKSRVSWDTEMYCFLDAGGTTRLKQMITKSRLWPVEIMRSLAPLSKLGAEDSEIPFHSLAFVDFGQLLYPGVQRIRGAYSVQPFSEEDLLNKANRSISVLKKKAKVAASQAKDIASPNKAEKSMNESNKGPTDSNEQGRKMYVEARTYIIIEITLEKPLIPKTSPEELAQRVMALIPPKPKHPASPSRAERLVVRHPHEPSFMFERGGLYMQTGDYLKAKECYHDAVSIDQVHLPSLMMCGVLAVMFEHYSEAQTFLERATSLDPLSVVAWTLLGLFHVGQNDSIQAERAFMEATKLLNAEEAKKQEQSEEKRWKEKEKKHEEEENKQEADETTKSLRVMQELVDQDSEMHKEEPPALSVSLKSAPVTIYTQTIQFLLQNNALQMAEVTLSKELLCSDGGRSASYFLHLPQLQLPKADYCSAASNLKEALSSIDQQTAMSSRPRSQKQFSQNKCGLGGKTKTYNQTAQLCEVLKQERQLAELKAKHDEGTQELKHLKDRTEELWEDFKKLLERFQEAVREDEDADDALEEAKAEALAQRKVFIQMEAELENREKKYAELKEKKEELERQVQRHSKYMDYMELLVKTTKFNDVEALTGFLERILNLQDECHKTRCDD